MKAGRLKTFFTEFKARYSEHESRRASILLGTQIALFPQLLATVVMLIFTNNTGQRLMYFTLVIGLTVLVAAALAFNLKGKYRVSAWLTTIAMVLGPWGAILFDKTVVMGDFVPLVYIALSIQLCSLLLSEKATLIIAVVQLGSLAALLLTSSNLLALNWVSLVIFIVLTAVLGMISSYLSRRQMEELEKQKRELQNDKIQLRALSVRDSLTGLYNRRYMEETLEKEIGIAIKENHSLGIILADVDNFKKINDTYGHAAGDSVLCDIADILLQNSRTSDAACRLGGDEFVLVLPGNSLSQTMKKAESLRAVIRNRIFRYGDVDLGKVALSFGIAAVPESGLRVEEVLKAADDALYAAKKVVRETEMAIQY